MHAPRAPRLLTPTNNSNVTASASNTFTWQFVPYTTGDTQQSANLQWKVYGGPSWTVITGASSTSTAAYTFPGATFTGGVAYEWQVQTVGSTGLLGPWSGSFVVNALGAVPAAPTITSPTSGSTPTSSPLTVTWTNAGGVTQDQYEVRRTSDTVGTQIYYDSGIVASAALTATVPLDTAPGRTDHIQVRVHSAGQWSTWADITIIYAAAATAPASPLLWAIPDPATASVTVRIVNPVPAGTQSATASNDLYRADANGVLTRIAAALGPNALFVDWFPGAGQVAYQAVASSPGGTTSPQLLSDIGASGGTLTQVFAQYSTLAKV